jgi:hypothetical protein
VTYWGPRWEGTISLWRYVPRPYIVESVKKLQQRLELLADIKHTPMPWFRWKLIYLAIVLECDTPIIEAIHHHSGLSITFDKN